MGMFISYELETGVRELRCELSHWNMFKNLRDPLRCVGRSDAGPMDVNATGTLGGGSQVERRRRENRGAVGGDGGGW